MEKALGGRNLKQVGSTQNGVDFLALTADSGTPGPEWFVRIMYLRHWDLGNEDVYSATAPRIRKLPEKVDVFTAEFAMADANAVERYNLALVLKIHSMGPLDSRRRAVRRGGGGHLGGTARGFAAPVRGCPRELDRG